MDISFIIPAHNAQDYLQRAIDSIDSSMLNLDYAYEIIVVENFSTDQTKAILTKLVEQKTQLKAVYATKKGVSHARNLGIKTATGKYIVFIDADDYLVKDQVAATLAKLHAYPTADLYVTSYEVGEGEFSVAAKDQKYQGDCLTIKQQMLGNPTKFMPVWAKIFQRELIEKHHLSFDENLRLAEDGDFMLRYLTFCDEIVLLVNKFYHYSNDNDSAMRTFDGQKTKDYLVALKTSKDYLAKHCQILLPAYNKYILMHLNVIMVREVFVSENSLTYAQKMQWCKKIIKEPIFKVALTQTKFKECTSPRMIPILFLKLRLYGLASIIFKLRVAQNLKAKK